MSVSYLITMMKKV